MNRRSLAALVTVNAALLAALVVTLFSPQPAHGQFGAASQYTMIAGQSQLRNDQAIVYVIDTRSGALVSLLFNAANNRLEPVGSRVLSQDTGNGGGGR